MQKQLFIILFFVIPFCKAQNDVYFDGVWILESLTINNEILSPPSNEEIDQVFLGFEFNNNVEPDGIIIEFCRWAYNFIDLPGDASTGFISIGEVDPSDNTCSLEESLSFDALYFNFYNSDDDGVFEYELDLESNNSTLLFRSSNGDEVLYRDTTLSIEENNFSTLKLYPVPSKNEVFIYSDNSTEIKEIHVFDLKGKKMIIRNKHNSLNLENLPQGMYIMELVGQNGLKTIRKFIKS